MGIDKKKEGGEASLFFYLEFWFEFWKFASRFLPAKNDLIMSRMIADIERPVFLARFLILLSSSSSIRM